MFIVLRLIHADVFWRGMSDIVDTKAENYTKIFIGKFHLEAKK